MRRVMFKTNGTMTRQTMSFTKNAEKIPDVKITAGKNRAGLNRRSTTSAIHSKKPTRCRLPTISIIENSRTIVEKSMKCRACAGETTRAATIASVPMMAAPGRSIYEFWELVDSENQENGEQNDV